jgi:hypothetical protein
MTFEMGDVVEWIGKDHVEQSPRGVWTVKAGDRGTYITDDGSDEVVVTFPPMAPSTPNRNVRRIGPAENARDEST